MNTFTPKNAEQERQFWRQQLHEEVRLQRLQLPTLPELTQKLRQIVSDNNAPVRTLAHVIQTDPSLSTRITQAASAAWMGLESANSLEIAITRLGYNAVRGMVYNHCLSRLFRERQTGPLRDELRRIWLRATLTGAYGQRLALHLNIENSHALLAGLLHNIGALPVLSLFAQHKKQLAGKLDLMHWLIAEEQGTLGEMILRQWQVPEDLIPVPKGILTDHPERPTQVIDLARISLLLAIWYETPDSTVPRIDQVPAMQRLRMTLPQLEKFLQETRRDIGEFIQLLQA